MVVALPLLLCGCFVLDIFFPLPGESSRNLSVFLHYKNIGLSNHEMYSVEFDVQTIAFNGTTITLDKPYTLLLDPERQISSQSDFFNNEDIFFGQFSFDQSKSEVTNPNLKVTFGSVATITYIEYLKDEITEEVTVEASPFAFTLSTTVYNAYVMELTSTAFNARSKLSLPKGQSKLLLMLDLSSIPSLNAVKEGATRSFTMGNSISMLAKDLCCIYGNVSDSSQSNTLVEGQYWTVNFDDTSNIFFNDYYWAFGTYPINDSLRYHRYFFFVPQITNQSYTVYFDVYIPDQINSIGRKEFEVTDVDEKQVNLTITETS
jgi:hypothetical protein